jgi:uncharacterized protein with FMN-binding domain
MKRAPIVISATVIGIAAVLSFHTKPASLTLGSLPGASATRSSTTTTLPAGAHSGQSSNGTSPPPTSSSTTTTRPSASRSATGAAVNYHYGILSVSVTASGKKITNVAIASLNDGGNFRSQSIDQHSIPILQQQAMQAQSANIQGVSGASYTSAGFQQSLQSALNQLGLS